MARTPVRLTDLSTDTAQVVNTAPSTSTYGLVVWLAGGGAGSVATQPQASTWSSVASATNGTATASKAGAAGQRLYITSIAASFDRPPTVARRMDLRNGASNAFSAFIADPFQHGFGSPLQLSAGATANLVLAAGGTGVIGLVAMTGYSAT